MLVNYFYNTNNKYICNKLINILKPNSDLPESKKDDIGIEFDYNITAEMRKICYESIALIIKKDNIEDLDEICNKYVATMIKIILNYNGIEKDDFNYYNKEAPEKIKSIFKNKVNNIQIYLIENEVPNLKMAILFSCGENPTKDDYEEYFMEGGSSKKKSSISSSNIANYEKMCINNFANIINKQLDKNLISYFYTRNVNINLNIFNNLNNDPKIKAKSNKSLNARSKRSSFNKSLKKNRSASARIINSKKNEILKLSTEDNINFSLLKLDITDKQYKNLIKKNYEKIKNNYNFNLINNKSNTSKRSQSRRSQSRRSQSRRLQSRRLQSRNKRLSRRSINSRR